VTYWPDFGVTPEGEEITQTLPCDGQGFLWHAGHDRPFLRTTSVEFSVDTSHTPLGAEQRRNG
jgi:hypothetical protein